MSEPDLGERDDVCVCCGRGVGHSLELVFYEPAVLGERVVAETLGGEVPVAVGDLVGGDLGRGFSGSYWGVTRSKRVTRSLRISTISSHWEGRHTRTRTVLEASAATSEKAASQRRCSVVGYSLSRLSSATRSSWRCGRPDEKLGALGRS